MTKSSQIRPYEQRVINLVAQGKPNKIVAFECGLTESTVRVYLYHIYKKLEVSNRTALAMRIAGLAIALDQKHPEGIATEIRSGARST